MKETSVKLVKIGEAAKILGVSIDTLRRWETSGKIKAIRTPGGTRLYNSEELRRTQLASISDLSETNWHNYLSSQAQNPPVIINPNATLPGVQQAQHHLVGGLRGVLTTILLVTGTLLLVTVSNKLLNLYQIDRGDNRPSLIGSLNNNILAENTTRGFLQVNGDVEIKGAALAQSYNGLSLEGLDTGFSIATDSGSLTISGDITLNQNLSTTSSPTFTALTTTGVITSAGLTNSGASSLTGAVTLGNILHLGSLSSEPSSASNGQTYYNTTSNKFRCYQNKSWKDCDTDTTGTTFSDLTLAGSAGTSQTIGSGNTITIAAGNGVITTAAATDTLTVDLDVTTTSTSTTTTANSGLELTSAGLSLLRGCSADQSLIWDATNVYWKCGASGSFTAAGDSGTSQLISSGDTFTIVGGTNGIDTVASATDTLTLNLDTTEIGTNTFGSGSGVTWTFDVGATDPTLTFASNSITVGASVLTVSGSADGTDALVLTAGDILVSNGDLDLSGGDFNVTLDSGDGASVTSNAAATADAFTSTLTGVGSDAIQINLTQSDDEDATDNSAGLRLALTSSSGDADLLYGIDIGNITEGTAAEVAFRIGSGWTNLIELEGATNDGIETYFQVTEPTSTDKTITFPNASGEVCLVAAGNCAGSGTGVTTAGGTANTLAKFSGSQAIANSTITDDGSVVTFTVDVDLTFAAGENLSLTNSSASTDQVSLSISGVTTDGADAITLAFTQATDSAADTNSGINLAMTGDSTDATDTLIGINIANLAGASAAAVSHAIQIGNTWDNNLYLNDTTSRVLLADGGTIVIHDGTNTLCTITDSGTTGDLSCSGNLTGGSSGTQGFWTRTSTTISPATANDIVSIANTNTTGADLAITNTGAYTGTGIFNLTANSATTGNIAVLSGTGMTTGEILDLTGTWAPTNGSTNEAIDLNITHTNTTSADNFQSINLTTTDGTALGNTVYNLQGTLTLTGNAAKTGVGLYSTVTSSSTTGDTLVAFDAATSSTGILGATTRNNYGLRSIPVNTGANNNASSIINMYGGYFNPQSTGPTTGTTTVYGLYSKTLATHAADAGTINQYGLYIANDSTATTNGTSIKYGLYLENLTGADTNYGIFVDAAIGEYGLALDSVAGIRTVPQIDINEDNTTGTVPTIQWDSAETRGGLLDVNLTGALVTENLIDVDTTAAFTSNLIDITTATSASSGNLIDLNFGNIADTGDAINVSMGGAAVGAQALVVSTSAGIRTASAFAITENNTSGTVATFDIDGASTRGGLLDIDWTGALVTENLIDVAANSIATANVLNISATGLTTGDALNIAGPTSTGITSGVSAGLVSIASDVGSAGTAGVLVYLAPDFSAGSATSGYGLYLNATDGTAIANADFGYYGVLTLTGNAAKTGYGISQSTTSSSTTADTLIDLDLTTDVTGIITTGTRSVYGIRNKPAVGAESTGGTTNVYGEYIQIAADVAAGGTVNGYGLYVDNGTYDTDGTSTQYGVYINTQSGADTNYALVSAIGAGNFGIGTVAPTAKLDVDTTQTSGDVINISVPSSTTLVSTTRGINIDLSTNVTATDQTLIGANLSLVKAGTPTGIAIGAVTTSASTGTATGLSIGALSANVGDTTGDGADGAVTFSTDFNLNTAAARSCLNDDTTYGATLGWAPIYISTADTAAAATTIVLTTSPASACLAAGDEVLIINLMGTSGANSDVGEWETKTISSISGATLTIPALTNGYTGSTQKIMVMRIPNFTSVTVDATKTLTALGFDNTTGGVLFFRATGTVTVNGTITGNSLGYAGGAGGDTSDTWTNGSRGQSYDNTGADAANTARTLGNASGTTGQVTGAGTAGTRGGGGGGGGCCGGAGGGGYGGGGGGGGGGANTTGGAGGSSGGTGVDGGGGGGGSTTTGGAGGSGAAGANGDGATPGTGGAVGSSATTGQGGGTSTANNTAGGGGGGGRYGAASLSSSIFLGSGGGGGGGQTSTAGASGGAGGGIVMVFATTITNSGTISSNGTAGTAGAGNRGPSGGGAGGSIFLSAPTVTVGTVTATGGAGAAVSSNLGGSGAGGVGRVKCDKSGGGCSGSTPAVGSSSDAGSATNIYGLSLSTLTGGSTANYQITTGALTSIASATNYQINLGAVTGAASATFGGINTGALSGAGTTSYGLNLGANTSTATTNYGINVGAISGAGTNNYGLYVGSVTGATNNYAAIFAGGNVGIAVTAPTSILSTAGTITASGAVARGVNFATTVTAAATSDSLQAVRIAPTIGTGAGSYTGLTSYALLLDGRGSTGNGTVATAYAQQIIPPDFGTTRVGLYITAVSGGTNNYSLITDGGNVGIGDTTPTEAVLVVGSAGAGDIFLTLATAGTTNDAVCWDNAGATLLYDCDGTPADYAEVYPVEKGIEYGEVVSIGTLDVVTKIGTKVKQLVKASTPYDSKILGITSDNWHDFTSAGKEEINLQDNPMPVALNGRVPVKVSTENGPIEVGDYLTSSSTPGVTMKATRPGQVVGKALEPFGSGQALETGKILVFVNMSWADPGNFFTSLSLDSEGNLIVPKIKVGSLTLDKNLIPTTTPSALSQGITEPQATNTEATYNIAEKLAELEIRIRNLESGEATSSAQLTQSPTEATPSSELALEPVDILISTQSASLANLNITETLSSEKLLTALDISVSGIFKALGQTVLGTTIIAGDLTVDGTFSISQNAINALPTLYIQNSLLATDINLFNGKVTIDKEGRLVAETITASEYQGVSGKSVGIGKILSGTKSVEIQSTLIKGNSKVLLTPTIETNYTLAVTSKIAGEKFTVSIPTPTLVDIPFDWFIINESNTPNLTN